LETLEKEGKIKAAPNQPAEIFINQSDREFKKPD